MAISYAEEFNYTQNHITSYSNDDITVVFYKNRSIIEESNLKIPSINFGDCYSKIKSDFNISENENLIISVVEKKLKNSVETYYLFFHPLSGLQLEVGNICKNDTIEIKENLISKLDEKNENYELQKSLAEQGINIFDLSDPYYNDICFDFDNPYDRDIALKDRVEEIFPNVTLCDEGCTNTGIDLKNNKATCNCKFNELTNNDLIQENAAIDYFFGEAFDLIHSSNILVLKCYKDIFKHFSRSIGAIIILSIFIINIICSLIFIFYELSKLKIYIFSLSEKFCSFLLNYKDIIKFFPPKRKSIKIKENYININIISKEKEEDKVNINRVQTKKTTLKELNKNNLGSHLNSNEDVKFNKEIIQEDDKNNNKENSEKNIEEGKKLKKYFKKYLSTLPDDMPFDEAIKKDKRTFCFFFFDNIKQKQSFAYTFLYYEPIKPRMIKIILFFLNFVLYFVVCGLFYGESYISELYKIKKEDEKFFSFVPRVIDKIIYTTFVTTAIAYMVDFFFVEEKKVKGIFKREKDNTFILKRSITLLIKEIKKRYISFIIMTLIILIISLYYILCFNYVYPKTQIEWIKSSILIVIIMQILSILKCFYETVFRYLSFRFESEKLFKASRIFG